MAMNDTTLKTESRKIMYNKAGVKISLYEAYTFKNDAGREIDVSPGMTIQSLGGKIRLDPGQAVTLLSFLTNDKAARSLLKEMYELQVQREAQQNKLIW